MVVAAADVIITTGGAGGVGIIPELDADVAGTCSAFGSMLPVPPVAPEEEEGTSTLSSSPIST